MSLEPDCSTEYSSRLYAECAGLLHPYPDPEPRWGWILMAVMGLALLFVLDTINDMRRHR